MELDVVDLMLPGIGSAAQALVKIVLLCKEMHEGERACLRLHTRLRDLLTEFDSMAERSVLPAGDAVRKYSDIIRSYTTFLEQYRAKKIFIRLVENRRMMEELRVMNEDVDMLFKMLNLASVASLISWRNQWEADKTNQEQVMAAIVANDVSILSELRGMRAQMESMIRLKHEIDTGAARQSTEIMALIKSMLSTVARVSKGSVTRVPPWYLPSDMVRYDSKPFAVGSFGSVHHGVWGFGTNIVVKCMLVTDDGINDRARQSFLKEVDLWYQFNHPHVVTMYGASHFSMPPYVVCEQAENGNLANFLATSEGNRQLTWRLLYQAALGLDYIHQKKVVHGDLKCNNILVSGDRRAKVADFGLSVMRTASSSAASKTLRASMLATTANPSKAGEVSGGLRWKAPECLKRRPTFASDVYSFAMCIIEAVTGEIPFGFLDDDDVRYNLSKGEIPEQPKELTDDVWHLIEQMMSFQPGDRVELSTVIQKLKSLAENEKKEQTASCRNVCPTCFSSQPMTSLYCADCGTSLTTNNLPTGSMTPHLQVKEPPYPRSRCSDAVTELAPLVVAEPNALQLNTRDDSRAWPLILQADNEPPSSAIDSERITTFVPRLEKSKSPFVKSGDIALLVTLLTSSMPLTKHSIKPDHAAHAEALGTLAWKNAENQVEIVRLGAIPPLLCLLREGGELTKRVAAEALSNLVNSVSQDQIVQGGAIPALISLLQQGCDPAAMGFAARTLGELSKESAEIRFQIAEGGAIFSLLVSLLRHNDHEVKSSAAHALASLASLASAYQSDIAREGAIPLLVGLMKGNCDDAIQAATALTLARLAGKSPENRVLIAQEGAIPLLVGLLKLNQIHGDTQHDIIKALATLAWSNSQNQDEIMRQGGVPLLVCLLGDGNAETKSLAALAVDKLADGNTVLQTAIGQSGAIPLLARLLKSSNSVANRLAAQAIGSLGWCHSSNQVEIERQGALPLLISQVNKGNEMTADCAMLALMRLSIGNGAIRSSLVALSLAVKVTST